MYDLCEIAEAAWIDVRTLWHTPAYMACIDEFHAKAGLKPFVHEAAAITIDALMERGRERRARETTSSKPGEAVARTVRALVDAMVRSGLTGADDAARIPELSALGRGEAGGSQLDRWRRYLGELQRGAMLADSFPRSLKILLHVSKMAPRDLQRRIDRAFRIADRARHHIQLGARAPRTQLRGAGDRRADRAVLPARERSADGEDLRRLPGCADHTSWRPAASRSPGASTPICPSTTRRCRPASSAAS